MPINLTASLTKRLLEQPESGMGYQMVQVKTTNQWLTKEAVVFNAEMLFYLEEKELKILSESESFDLIKKYASLSTDIVDITVKSKISFKKFANIQESDSTKGADNAPVESIGLANIFKRFTGFVNDNRMNTDRSLKPGTYATTELDAKNVRIRIDAIKRYALPKENTAKYVFTIEPIQGTKIQKGIVQPNFNQPGGGIEILFVNGTTTSTVIIPPKEVPEK